MYPKSILKWKKPEKLVKYFGHSINVEVYRMNDSYLVTVQQIQQ